MVRQEKLKIKSATLGKANPLPDIKNVSYIHAGFEVKPSLSEEEREHLGKGLIGTILPYTIQDGYDRNKKEIEIETVVLENEYLRAEFLPEYGARLWSLYDKKVGKELLFKNPVIQPCNFAIRNAWLAGGIEFNVGIKGHNPLTCEPMFCEFVGENAVRFFEYERIRGLAYGITAYLPKDSETLYIRTTVENRSKAPTYNYWWTNIAFPETKNTRVIAPATDAIHCLYQENHYVLDKAQIPYDNGTDVSYSLNMQASSDYFYRIPATEKKWEAAVDKNGTGLFEYSDDKLKSRKLFLWGNGVGGRHWNEFLAENGCAYIEIQAGILNTQLEHILMPAETEWSWTQGFTSLNGDNEKLYGDWTEAQNEVIRQFNEKVKKGAAVDFDELDNIVINGERKLVYKGKSWGRLENELRKQNNENPISENYNFELTPNDETAEFENLVFKGYLPYKKPSEYPSAYVTGEKWIKLLQNSLQSLKGKHWYTYLQLGVALYAGGELKEAEECWKKSVESEKNLWALRNLSALYKNEYKDIKTALYYAKSAYVMAGAKENVSFLREYASMLIDGNECSEYVKEYERLPEKMQADGRLKIYLAQAYLRLGLPEKSAALITPDFVLCDVKEGELSVSKLWYDIYTAIVEKESGVNAEQAQKIAKEKYPLPNSLDFRMHD